MNIAHSVSDHGMDDWLFETATHHRRTYSTESKLNADMQLHITHAAAAAIRVRNTADAITTSWARLFCVFFLFLLQ